MSMDDMDGSDSCKMSMLWNWYTVDTCFISSTWHNTSKGMFAGSCIGVILLVISLEFLRRVGKEYDRWIVRQAREHMISNPGLAQDIYKNSWVKVASSSAQAVDRSKTLPEGQIPINCHVRPGIRDQLVRATLHMLQFAVAYFIMLLAMYYNGYIIICIFIGAWIGSFIFHWERMPLGLASGSSSNFTNADLVIVELLRSRPYAVGKASTKGSDEGYFRETRRVHPNASA